MRRKRLLIDEDAKVREVNVELCGAGVITGRLQLFLGGFDSVAAISCHFNQQGQDKNWHTAAFKKHVQSTKNEVSKANSIHHSHQAIWA